MLLASFALTGYAGVRLLDGDALGVAGWLVGAAVVHDLVLVPVYGAADRALRAAAGPYVNYVRVPAFLSGVLLLVWFPLIVGPPARYGPATGLHGADFGRRWLLLTAGVFACSALCLAVRAARRASRARCSRSRATSR
ncbi:hypothetical protein G5C65_12685 [Streptomyces sp. SB3404]|uniref:Uncharacterized protein n=1 Tax=Streptomyces boncukensis TaxID=2711219 RepID=A0A6G4WVQ9_9ACTN|nr:hypothetical protein [Streptomyces boncukensis]